MTEYEEIENKVRTLRKQVDDSYKECELEIIIEDNKLSDCIANQTTLALEWEKLYSRVKYVLARADEYTERCFSYAYVHELQNNKRSLGATECKNFASVNPDYVKSKRIYNEAKFLKEDVEAVVNVIRSRQFALRDLENAIIHEIKDHII